MQTSLHVPFKDVSEIVRQKANSHTKQTEVPLNRPGGMREAVRRPLLQQGMQACWTHKQVPVFKFPVKFLSSSSLAQFLPSSCHQVLPVLVSWFLSWPGSVFIPLLNPPRRPAHSAGPAQKLAGRPPVFRSKFQLLAGSAFYRLLVDFGSPKAPQNGTKT